MPLDPTFNLVRPHVRRKRRPAPSAPAAALVLVIATYENLNPSVLALTFERAIDLAGFDPAAVVVDDQPATGQRWVGTDEVGQPDDATVRITLVATGPATPGPVALTASAANGIVAVDDGGAWAGATNLGLPYP